MKHIVDRQLFLGRQISLRFLLQHFYRINQVAGLVAMNADPPITWNDGVSPRSSPGSSCIIPSDAPSARLR